MKLSQPFYAVVLITTSVQTVWAENLEEVVVTASPFAKKLETLNHPANVLSGDALAQAAAATLGETLADQAGVSSASFGPGVGLPIIRGQSDNRVKVMQDSIGSMDASSASPDHAITLEPLLASKIEVLRGPAALRYGSGAIGGVVNVLDKRIADSLPVKMSGGGELRHANGNDETVGVVNINGALKNVALHADGIKRQNNNLDIPGHAEKYPVNMEDSSKGFIANTDAELDSGTLGASYIGDSGFMGVSINRLNNNYGVPPEGDEWVRIDMHQTRYDIKGELNDISSEIAKVTLRVGHNDYAHTEMENGEAGTQFHNDAYEGRIEIIHHPIMEWQGALGLQLSESTFSALGEEAFIPKSDGKNAGIFIVEETSLGPWDYELGARLDWQSIAAEGGDSITHNSVNLSGSTRWHFTEMHQLTLGIAQSQRAPSLEELLADGPHPATGSYLTGDRAMQEETSSNVEFGYHWHTDQVKFSANIFINSLENFIYAANTGIEIDGLNALQYRQQDAMFKGFEAELAIPLYRQWQWRLMSDRVRAELDNGEDLPRITPPRLSNTLTYDNETWSGNITWIYTRSQTHPGPYEAPTDSYNRVDAGINWQIQSPALSYTVFLKARNIFNTEIRNASSYLRNIAPEEGRSLQAGARITF